MSYLSLDDFEALYERQGDPWKYETSAYERDKYAATLRACGPGPFHRALELGGSIGIFTALLADRCRWLISIDGARSAVERARERLFDRAGVEVVLGRIPEAIPDGGHDLIVASEILYYLDGDALSATLTRLRDVADPGARLVAVHWRPRGDERPFTASEVHRLLHMQPWLAPTHSAVTPEYLLDVFTRR